MSQELNLRKLNQSAIVDSECPITKKRHNPNQCEFCFDKCCSTGVKRTQCNCLICAFRRSKFGIEQEQRTEEKEGSS